MEKLLLRPEEAAEAMAISRTVIYELMRAGELASVKIGRSRRVAPGAIADYIERQRVRALDESDDASS